MGILSRIFRLLFSRPAEVSSSVVVGRGPEIQATAEEIAKARELNERVLVRLQAKMEASGIFLPDRIPEMIATLRADSTPFGRLNTKTLFNGEALSAQEKRALGLNVRMKYARKFISCINPRALAAIEPKGALESMHQKAACGEWSTRELRKLRDSGVCNRVHIRVGSDACKAIRRTAKRHALLAAPELPLPSCGAHFCTCYYEPIITV